MGYLDDLRAKGRRRHAIFLVVWLVVFVLSVLAYVDGHGPPMDPTRRWGMYFGFWSALMVGFQVLALRGKR